MCGIKDLKMGGTMFCDHRDGNVLNAMTSR